MMRLSDPKPAPYSYLQHQLHQGPFPEKYFNDKSVPALDMKIKKLMPMDAESRWLIDWMEKGVYDALQKKYLKTLLFCICESVEGPMIEEYSFSFSYSTGESDGVSMNITRNKKQGGSFKSNKMDITPNHMRSTACKMIRTLVQLKKTLDCMPVERIILMKLFYYDDATASDYGPPFFRGCTEQEANISWSKNPLKMEVGNVNSKHILLALKVKSVLDPCEEEDEAFEDGDVSLGEDSVQDGSYSSGSERQHSGADQYVVMPIDDDGAGSDDDTQDPDQDEVELASVRQWLTTIGTDTIDLSHVLSSFPRISPVLLREIIEKLIREGDSTVSGKDTYTINKTKNIASVMNPVKEEMNVEEIMQKDTTTKNGEDNHMYMEALYHTLPLEYVTITKLKKKLKGNTSLHTVRKLIDKMTLEGFLEAKSNGKLGKRVVHSEATDKKFEEVKKVLDMDMEIDNNSLAKSNPINFPSSPGCKENEESICGGLHSIGSDITRSLGKLMTNGNQTSSIIGKNTSKTTPLSKMQLPVASRESAVPAVNLKGMEMQNTMESRATQEKRVRKASMVKDPIPQLVKRLKVHAAA